VTRLVSGNFVQGLDIIVRHPTWGALVTVDVEGEIDPRSWVGAVRMYAMQTSLAYMNVLADNSSKLTIGPTDYPNIPVPTPAHSAFPDIPRNKTISRHVGSLGPYHPEKPTAAKFYHISLDLRAFVPSLCTRRDCRTLLFGLQALRISAVRHGRMLYHT